MHVLTLIQAEVCSWETCTHTHSSISNAATEKGTLGVVNKARDTGTHGTRGGTRETGGGTRGALAWFTKRETCKRDGSP